MATYKGPNRPAGGLMYWIPFCVTNNEKALFWAVIMLGETISGAIVGLIAGLIAGVVFGSPAAVTGIGAALTALLGGAAAVTGAAIGAVLGAAYGLWTCWNAACEECGSCFEVLMTRTLWPVSKVSSLLPVIPFVFRASPGDCTMVPPGCP